MSDARTIYAYELNGQDDGAYMLGEETYRPNAARSDWRFGSEGAPHPATCSGCGGKINPEYVNPQYRVKKRRRDITATYDGYLLVSAHLRGILKENGANSTDFVALPSDTGYFWLRPRSVLHYSAAERERACDSCGQFADVVVPVPLFLTQLAQPVSSGVYRSSMEFGSVPLKSCRIVVGKSTGIALQSASLKGVELDPLYAAV
jgi:hypothetical protein